MRDLSFVDNRVFDEAITIIIDILQEIYLKGGLAYVGITDKNDDAICYYRNLGIEILQNGYLPDVSAVMLELAINKVECSFNISMDQKSILILLRHLLPNIQTMNIEYILYFLNTFCSNNVVLSNYDKISKYKSVRMIDKEKN